MGPDRAQQTMGQSGIEAEMRVLTQNTHLDKWRVLAQGFHAKLCSDLRSCSLVLSSLVAVVGVGSGNTKE